MSSRKANPSEKAQANTEEVALDLNAPLFLDVFLSLEKKLLAQAAAALRRIRRLTWRQVYQSQGLKWEAIGTSERSNKGLYSIRVDQKMRAVVQRDGRFMRFLSLHPDHDSAYR